MSIEGTVVGAAPGAPDDPQGLQDEIERTREHLGQTVEALVAKVDVKARAQDEAGRLIGRLKSKVIQARQQAAARATEARRQVAASTAGPRQVRPQAAAVAAGISKATPEPVKQAAGNVVDTARRRRTPLLAGIGATAAGLVGWLLFQRWRQRR
jgi:Protein of unknown function (DUF3618)